MTVQTFSILLTVEHEQEVIDSAVIAKAVRLGVALKMTQWPLAVHAFMGDRFDVPQHRSPLREARETHAALRPAPVQTTLIVQGMKQGHKGQVK